MEVSEGGDLANWTTGKGIPAVGGAMDLVVGAKNVFVMSQHTTKDGSPKFLKNCSLPLTGKSVVTRVYSNLAILDVTPEGFKLKEMCEQIDFDLLRRTPPKNNNRSTNRANAGMHLAIQFFLFH